MKKVLSIAILFVMVAMLATTTVNAATNADLANKLYAIGAKYGMTSADKVKIERYLADNPVTDAEADQVVAKAQQTAKDGRRGLWKDYFEIMEAMSND